MPHLYPLTNEKFMELHREAWENGWTYGPGFDELYDDYLINWVYFVDYLDLLINTCVDNTRPRQYERSSSDVVTLCFDDGQVKYIHVPDHYRIFFNHYNKPVQKEPLNIFIGEAPPFWKGSSNNSDRTYFYNPTHTNSSDWLEVPLKIFIYTSVKGLTGTQLKLIKLHFLSKKSCVLIDIFPFPIIQDTEIRKKITGEFSSFLEKHFVKKYKNVLEYVYDKKFEKILKESEPKSKHAIAMPLYGSLQITFGPNSRKVMDDLGIFQKGICLKGSLSAVKWKLKDNGRQTFNVIIIKKNKNKETDRLEFIKKLLEIGSIKEENIADWLECKTPEIPLLCSENGGLSHDNYLNSVNKNPVE